MRSTPERWFKSLYGTVLVGLCFPLANHVVLSFTHKALPNLRAHLLAKMGSGAKSSGMTLGLIRVPTPFLAPRSLSVHV